MRHRPPTPARIEFVDGVPLAPDFGDVYHARAGAMGQARHVFLGGNGLPGAWQGRRRFALLETGFGLGHNLLATWQAWRDDPRRCERLDFVSVELHPPVRADLERALAAGGAPADLAAALVAAWPPPTPGLHRLAFDGGRFVLWLALGDARDLLPALVGRFDAFYLDGFAPARNPDLWDRRLLACLGRLAAPGATAATWSVARAAREGLVQAGFALSRAPGYDRKREMTVARHMPRGPLRPLPGRPAAAVPRDPAQADRPCRAVVVGAGLAGAAVAQALAGRGWSCSVLDRALEPAHGASGNPAGLFHGTLPEEEGPHARLLRAAALLAAPGYAALVAAGVPGAVDGLVAWRRDRPPTACPPGYACHGDAEAAAGWAGVPLPGPATLYAQAGWVDPGAVVRAWLATPGVVFRGGVEVAAVRRAAPSSAPPDAAAGAAPLAAAWELLAPDGRVIDSAEVVVIASGAGLPALEGPDGPVDTALGLHPVRGQVTWFDSATALRRPVTGQGYALSLPDGRLLCGATAHRADPEAAPRAADTAFNLGRLKALTGIEPAAGRACGGRVGWRLGTADRLPVVGAWPDAAAAARGRSDQARWIPRLPGLFVAGGFGSRGLTWAPLAAEVIAAWIDGTPMPLEADLLDAIDPARGWVRRARRAGPGRSMAA